MIQLEINDHEYQINSNNYTSLTSVHIKLSSVDNVFLHETLETLITWSSKEIIKLYHGKIISYFHSWKPRVDSNWGEQHFNTNSKAVKKQKKEKKKVCLGLLFDHLFHFPVYLSWSPRMLEV